MQPFNMLLLAVMAFVISLTSAAALVSSVPISDTHPMDHPFGSLTGSWKSKQKSAWGEWTGQPTHSHSISISISMTEDDAPSSTSTIHLTETIQVTAITRRDDEHKSHKPQLPWAHETGTSETTGSFSGTKSWTKSSHHTDSRMTSVTLTVRDDDVDEGCSMVVFHGGGFCVLSAKTKRGGDVMTLSHHFSDASPANTNSEGGIPRPPFTPSGFSSTASHTSSLRNGPGHGGKSTSAGMVSVTIMMAPPTTTMLTMPSYSKGASSSE